MGLWNNGYEIVEVSGVTHIWADGTIVYGSPEAPPEHAPPATPAPDPTPDPLPPPDAIPGTYGDFANAVGLAEAGLNQYRENCWVWATSNNYAHANSDGNQSRRIARIMSGAQSPTLAYAERVLFSDGFVGLSLTNPGYWKNAHYEVPDLLIVCARGRHSIFEFGANGSRWRFNREGSRPNGRAPLACYQPTGSRDYLAEYRGDPVNYMKWNVLKGGTHNQRLVRVLEFYMDGLLMAGPDAATKREASKKFFDDWYERAVTRHYLHPEHGSVPYDKIYIQIFGALALGLPVSADLKRQAQAILYQYICYFTTSFLDGFILKPNARMKSQNGGFLPYLFGGDTYRQPLKEFNAIACEALVGVDALSRFDGDPRLRQIAHWQGVLTAEELVQGEKSPTSPGTNNALMTRNVWTFRNKLDELSMTVSTGFFPASRYGNMATIQQNGQFTADPPVWSMNAINQGGVINVFNMTAGQPSNKTNYGWSDNNQTNRVLDWHFQFHNAVALVVDGAREVRCIMTHQIEAGGATEIINDGNWFYARYGSAYVVLWLSGARTLQAARTSLVGGSFTKPMGQIVGAVGTNGRAGSYMGFFHRRQFGTLAALQTFIRANCSAQFENGTRTLNLNVPVTTANAPDQVDLRRILVTHRTAGASEKRLVDGQSWREPTHSSIVGHAVEEGQNVDLSP